MCIRDRVLTNLLENAVRHGGARVRISARPVAGEAMVEIVVEDDGPGVAAAELPHLFEKFYRAGGSKARSSHGMGVGLTVAEGLTRAMHGSIVADRSELGGLAVRVRLPWIELPADDGEPSEGDDLPADAPVVEPAIEPADAAT